jgi:hypothetical protein
MLNRSLQIASLWLALIAAWPALASQATLVTPGSPLPMTSLATFLNSALLSIGSCNAGNSAPANGPSAAAFNYECWANAAGAPTSIAFALYDGAQWVTFGTLNATAHTWTPYLGANPTVETAPLSGSLSSGLLTIALQYDANFTNNGSNQLAFANIAAGNLLANGTSGSAEPTGTSPSAWLNQWCSSAQYNFPQRGESSWACGTISGLLVQGTGITLSGTGQVTVTLNAASAGAIGGVNSITSLAHNWIAYIDTAGLPHQSQPTFADISGTLGSSQCPAGTTSAIGCLEGDNATLAISAGVIAIALSHPNTWTGTQTFPANSLTLGELAQIAGLSVLGNCGSANANVAAQTGTASQFFGVNAAGTGCGFQTMSGDATLSGGALTVAANAITNAKAAQMAANTVKGNPTGSTATAQDVPPATARSSSLLNIDACTSTGSSAYGIASTDRCVYHTALTAAVTDTLPAANSVNVGQLLYVVDFRGVASGTNTITLQTNGSDTVNGSTSAIAISSQYGWSVWMSDGVSRWTYQQGGGGGDGAGTVTSVGIAGTTNDISVSGTCTITTSGTCTIDLASARKTLPTIQAFLSGSGTYTTPANTLWIEIYLVGGGGGGAGGGGAVSTGSTSGGNTCWNTSGSACTSPVYQAGGGAGATSALAGGGAGGTVSGSGTCNVLSVAGGAGKPGNQGVNSTVTPPGGNGGASTLGGDGGGIIAGAGAAAAANSGSGGAGGGGPASNAAFSGGGGGAGATCRVIINSPAASYTYAIGAAGTGAPAGGSGFAGANGAAGRIFVIEHYGSWLLKRDLDPGNDNSPAFVDLTA